MLPIYLLVVFLTYTPVISMLQEYLAPVMHIFALPGDAAVPIVTGFFSDEYGVVAAMSGFDFSRAQITTIAMIVLCFHSIPVEAAVGRQIGFHPGKYSLYRFIIAVVTGILCGWLTGLMYGGGAASGGAAMSAQGAASAASASGGFFEAGWHTAMLSDMLTGGISVAWSLARVIVPLMVVIEFMLAYRLVERFAPKLGWLRRVLGISPDALLPLLVGLFMGVTYGAGTIMEINRRKPMSSRDFRLIGIFLYACHGVIETTVLFAVAGGSVFFVCVLRIAVAVAITAAAARLPLLKEA
jgi:hypothetical protein